MKKQNISSSTLRVVNQIRNTLKKPMTFHMLVHELGESEARVEKACRYMICETGEMQDINAWLRIKPQPLPGLETIDDLHWLLGAGRFAQ